MNTKTLWLLGLCGVLMTATACDSDSDSGGVIGIPGDPPTVNLSGVPPTITVGEPLDFSASVAAPSGLRTTDTFQVTFSGLISDTDSFDASEVPNCSGGSTFCTATLSQLLGNPIVFEQPGTLTFTLTAFDGFNTAGSGTAVIQVQ